MPGSWPVSRGSSGPGCTVRSLVDDVELRFINVAQWDSGKALDAARADPEWRASMKRVLDDPDLHVTPRPVVYQVAIDVHPGDPL
ncbi:MAG: hypothetical protein WAN20_23315 [Pseudonocardiaceae bacterium]